MLSSSICFFVASRGRLVGSRHGAAYLLRQLVSDFDWYKPLAGLTAVAVLVGAVSSDSRVFRGICTEAGALTEAARRIGAMVGS